MRESDRMTIRRDESERESARVRAWESETDKSKRTHKPTRTYTNEINTWCDKDSVNILFEKSFHLALRFSKAVIF